jgi:hypothetical protein
MKSCIVYSRGRFNEPKDIEFLLINFLFCGTLLVEIIVPLLPVVQENGG